MWKKQRATESLKSGTENTSGVIKTEKNDQLEKHSNARNGFDHDNNEGENFDDEKHCKTLIEKSINSNERQSQNKNLALHFAGSKTSRRQMEEMLNNRKNKKLHVFYL